MRKLALTAALLWASLSLHAFAQTSNATLGGTVSDATEALLPGVLITATNTGTGIVSTTISNEAGAYNFPSLQTGTYTLSAELPGFQTLTFTNVLLGISQQVRQNFKLQVGSVATAVEVEVAADTLLATSSASVGSVLPEYRIRDLPLNNGNVLDLIVTTPGTVRSGERQGNFAGQRTSAVNVTRDGINVMDGRYEFGAFSAVFQSPDMVEEVRVIVGPSDAETSRGSGQVQLSSRSGTNQYRGSVFWTNQNSVLNANSWANNRNRVDKNYYNRNEYGARLGGPIVRNKTFFFAFFNGQRVMIKENVTGLVLTEQARQGIFRHFPGSDNQNASGTRPTVDLSGNPVDPTGQGRTVSSFSLFGRDPLRPAFDTSAFGREQLRRMPLPNDFNTSGNTGGDGLNTAAIRFLRRVPGRDVGVGEGVELNRDQYNLRLDQSFNANHKLSVIATREKDWSFGQPPARSWPTGFDGNTVKRPDIYTIKLVSTLSSSVVNELNLARKRSMNWAYSAANRDDEHGREALSYIPIANGIRFRPYPSVTTQFVYYGGFGQWREGLNPQKTISDSVSWTKGAHAFKSGVEWRFTQSNGFNDPDVTPRVNYATNNQPGGFPATGIDNTFFTGLTSTNANLARNILYELAGSIGTIQQSFVMKNAQDLNFYDTRDVRNNRQILFQREFSGFLKDDWKVRPNVTLNFGVHYEWYGAPYEKNGLAGYPVGGAKALECGYSCGLVKVELVGKNSPNPNKQTAPSDWNNWAPNFGLSWNIPWWGQDKTVLRLGYGVSYTGALRNFITVGGVLREPGMFIGNQGSGQTYTPTTYTNMTNITLPIPKALNMALQPIPLTDRTLTIEAYDHVSPYIQNFNLEFQREIARNTTVEVRYVGTKGTKLWGVLAQNTVDIFNNKILEAFNITRAGGDADLFNRMLMGINIGGGASTVNGTTVTGSQALRSNTTTRGYLANGNVGSLANYLNTQNVGTGQNGGLLRRNGFPEDFIVRNPQFAAANVRGNPGNSTYHSMQLQFTKRLSGGLTNSTSYTWSRTLGEADGDGGTTYRDPRNRSLDKTLLGFHRTHGLTSNGTWILPFGPNQTLLNNVPGWVARVVEGWQLGGIFTLSSGSPITVSTGLNLIQNSSNGSTPNIVGPFPKGTGEVAMTGALPNYFAGLRQIEDPSRAGVTTLQAVQNQFSNKAITDANGNLLLVNPAPGTLGTLGMNTLEGPGNIGLDMNLTKRVRIDETRNIELRVNAINILNTPNWNNPETNINSNNFGQVTGAGGSREFTTTLRFNF